jgi:tetratricopeptide (TPR) repeat protein
MAAPGVSVASEAYQLRMTGKLDEALALLESRVDTAPEDAAAHYELARTKMHMALGNPEDLSTKLAGAHESAVQAVAHDPGGIVYHTFAGHVAYFRAYHALQQGATDGEEHFTAACSAFEAALKLKPDYPQILLYLVELHAAFPQSAGADRAKANAYADTLAANEVYAAKARSVLALESCGVEFWQALLAKLPGNADVLEELGKAHLRSDEIEQAVKRFEEAIQRDSSRTYLYMDLSIYHTFGAMRAGQTDPEEFEKHLSAGDAAVTRYLDSNPSNPMRAYALGVKSKYMSVSGNMEQGKALFDEANALDPYFSKATALPHPDWFIPPTEASQNHRYLMRPF